MGGKINTQNATMVVVLLASIIMVSLAQGEPPKECVVFHHLEQVSKLTGTEESKTSAKNAEVLCNKALAKMQPPSQECVKAGILKKKLDEAWSDYDTANRTCEAAKSVMQPGVPQDCVKAGKLKIKLDEAWSDWDTANRACQTPPTKMQPPQHECVKAENLENKIDEAWFDWDRANQSCQTAKSKMQPGEPQECVKAGKLKTKLDETWSDWDTANRSCQKAKVDG